VGVSLPTSIDGVIARLQEIDGELPAADGVAVFNRMYLTVTRQIAALIDQAGAHTFLDPTTMADLDVRFANLWLTAYDADAAHATVPPAWQPLFEARHGGREGVQYAVAGMNTHIEHDLPVAVVETCRASGLGLGQVHADYDAVNDVLAQVESPIRRSFLDAVGRQVDDRLGAVVHVLSTWDIQSAREIAWGSAETLWALRDLGVLRDRFLDGLTRTVAMTTTTLLVPTA
jgi:hypothetical protein